MKQLRVLLLALVAIGVSGAAWAQQPVNVASLGGVTIDLGTGAAGAGTIRVAESNDSLLSTSVAALAAALQPEDDPHTNADTGFPLLCVQRASTTPTATAGTGDYAVPNCDSNGRWIVNATLYSSGGVELTSTEVVEDQAETAGGTGPMVLNVRRDTAASSASASGDNATFNSDALGRLWMRDGDPCSDPARITHAAITESTAATNEIVALNGSDLIYVCSYKWVTTAANSLSWTRGTGTDCATGTTAIEGAQPYAANGGVTEQGGGHALFVVPAGNALCLVSSTATAHGGRVSYVRTAAP